MSSIKSYENKVRKCRFAIIGAGMAGLGAAHALQQLNIHDFLILEAQGKPGGRIDTLYIGDSAIDLGAQWIHGTDTHVFNVAKENDLISNKTSNEGQGTYIRNDGLIYNDYFIKTVDFEVGRILENCEQFVDSEEYPPSVGYYLNEQFQKYLSYSSEDAELKLELLDWHLRFQEIDNSCIDLTLLSAKEWGRYSCLGKDGQQHINLKNGYASLIDCFTKTLPKDQILLNMPVESINYENEQNIIIRCKDNSLIYANHAIITMSIGVLKHCHQNLFHPKLPTAIQNTIDMMGFDGLGKVFLLFETKWWGDKEGIQLLWQKDAVVNEDLEWTKYITGFDVILNQNKMLLGWVSHKGCLTMEGLSESTVGRNCVDMLRMFFKNDLIPYPTKIYRTTWISNPYIRGGYSHETAACDRAGELSAVATLAQPVLDARGVPRLVLAGEAVHSTHFSTTHGAFESGEEQVKRLVAMLQTEGGGVEGNRVVGKGKDIVGEGEC